MFLYNLKDWSLNTGKYIGMTEFTGDKNYIENLLRALPVDEAIVLFSKIDNRIVNLLQCSSEDFLSLNDHFKNYHKESKNLAKSASEIIQIITDSHVSNSFANTIRNETIFCLKLLIAIVKLSILWVVFFISKSRNSTCFENKVVNEL